MKTHPRWRSTGAMLVAALVTAVIAALLPASPALALPSGAGWSASWSYYHPTAYQYAGSLPGVRLTGYATDNSGTSTTVGTIEDTADDGRCARVMLYAYGVGYVADRTTCANGSYLTYSTGSFSQGLLVIVYRMVPGTNTQDKGFAMYIPGSSADPEMRTVGTGASWSYYTSTAFRYAVTRPGVRLTGYGARVMLRISVNPPAVSPSPAGRVGQPHGQSTNASVQRAPERPESASSIATA